MRVVVLIKRVVGSAKADGLPFGNTCGCSPLHSRGGQLLLGRLVPRSTPCSSPFHGAYPSKRPESEKVSSRSVQMKNEISQAVLQCQTNGHSIFEILKKILRVYPT
jgi:hypothetical protein